VKLADFGCSTKTLLSGTGQSQALHSAVGTAQFMAPEIMMCGTLPSSTTVARINNSEAGALGGVDTTQPAHQAQCGGEVLLRRGMSATSGEEDGKDATGDVGEGQGQGQASAVGGGGGGGEEAEAVIRQAVGEPGYCLETLERQESKYSVHGDGDGDGGEEDEAAGGYGRKADIWSLGMSVIEMAQGTPAWPNAAHAIYNLCVTSDPPPLPDELSREAHHFLTACFEREPRYRPSASELLDHPFVAGSGAGGGGGGPRDDEGGECGGDREEGMNTVALAALTVVGQDARNDGSGGHSPLRRSVTTTPKGGARGGDSGLPRRAVSHERASYEGSRGSGDGLYGHTGGLRGGGSVRGGGRRGVSASFDVDVQRRRTERGEQVERGGDGGGGGRQHGGTEGGDSGRRRGWDEASGVGGASGRTGGKEVGERRESNGRIRSHQQGGGGGERWAKTLDIIGESASMASLDAPPLPTWERAVSDPVKGSPVREGGGGGGGGARQEEKDQAIDGDRGGSDSRGRAAVGGEEKEGGENGSDGPRSGGWLTGEDGDLEGGAQRGAPGGTPERSHRLCIVGTSTDIPRSPASPASPVLPASPLTYESDFESESDHASDHGAVSPGGGERGAGGGWDGYDPVDPDPLDPLEYSSKMSTHAEALEAVHAVRGAN
jgi:hypothetical protein